MSFKRFLILRLSSQKLCYFMRPDSGDHWPARQRSINQWRKRSGELTVFTPQMMATCHDQNTFTVEKILPKPSKLNGWRGGRACNVTWICPCWVRRFKRTRGYAITLLHGFTNYPKHCKQWLLSCPSTISVVLISVIIYNCLLSNSMFYCDFKVSNPQIYTLRTISW